MTEAPTRRHGLTIPLFDHTLAELGPIAREAESLGYTDLWSFEMSGVDGFSPLIVAATATERARLGTAIVSTYTRGPATLAISAAAVAEVAPGRSVLGLGASTEAIVEGWNGIKYEKPVTSVRETVRRVRDALEGRRMPLQAGARGAFRLDHAPSPPPPLYVAALRAGMLRMAGEVADGIIINFLPAAAVPTVISAARDGATAAGRDPDAVDVVARLMVCSDPWDDETRAACRFLLAVYVTSPPYEAFLRWVGLGELIDPALERWRAGDRAGALEVMSDELVRSLIVVGDPDECRARIEEYREAGVRTPVVAPLSGRSDVGERRAAVVRMVREMAPRD